MKVQSVAVIFLVIAFLLGPALVFSAPKIGVNVPDWLTAYNSRFLSGGIQEAEIANTLNVEGFASGKLQSALEIKIGNNIPLKYEALLGHSAAQRTFIKASNLIFGWNCYPTYYGSTKLYEPENDSLYRYPYDSNKKQLESFASFVELVDKAASAYPNKRFCVYLVDISQFALNNPGNPLVSCDKMGVLDYADLANAQADSSNLIFLGNEIPKSDNYHNYFYTTDHHWNGNGALRAYRSIASAIDLDDQANTVISTSNFFNLRMNGSDSRVGLMLLNAPAQEPLVNFEDVTIVKGDPAPFFNSSVSFARMPPPEAEFDFYHSWFGKGSVELLNEQRDRSVLLLGDSYTYSTRWLFGNSCRSVKQWADFSMGTPQKLKDEGVTLQDRINAANPDTVLLVAAPQDYLDMEQHHKGYFETK